MTIARAQMYRQLYQLGGSPTGIQTMPMDYGQSLQVPSQQQPMFTSTGNATSSPVLNYGQTEVGKAGGTPLTRNGYQEVQEDFMLAAIDIVADPSAPNAFVNGIMEGKEWVWDNGILKAREIENYHNIIKKSSPRKLEENMIKVFKHFLNNI